MSDEQHSFFGIHVLGEMFGIKRALLDDVELLEESLREGIKESGATLCGIQVKKFEPSGVTILALLSESHASIHTYPEEGSLFFDAFTCGETCRPEKIALVLRKVLAPSRDSIRRLERGNLENMTNGAITGADRNRPLGSLS